MSKNIYSQYRQILAYSKLYCLIVVAVRKSGIYCSQLIFDRHFSLELDITQALFRLEQGVPEADDRGITTHMFPTEHLASITPYINNLDRGHQNYVHFTHIFPILIRIFLKLRLGYIGRLNQSRFSLIGLKIIYITTKNRFAHVFQMYLVDLHYSIALYP